MNIPLFLEGQQISAYDKNNNIVEGAISLDENNNKVIKLEDRTVLFEDLTYVKFVGERLDEKLEDEIECDSQGIHWDKAAEDHVAAKERETLTDDFVKMETDKHAGKNKAEIETIAKDIANAKFMQADVDSGRVKPDGLIQDYIDEKNKKIESIEANMKQKIMEGDISRSEENYGEGNVYPIHDIPENEFDGTQGISQDADASAMLGDPVGESNPVDAVMSDIAGAESSPALEPMSTDLEVTSGEPVDYSSDFASIDADLADNPLITEVPSEESVDTPNYDFSEIDAALADDGTNDEAFDGLKDTLETSGVDTETANKVTNEIADDIASAVNHAVKDAVSAIDDSTAEPTVTEPVESDTSIMTEDENNNSPVSADAVAETPAEEMEDIDNQMEQVMDDYIADHGNDESGMYETLCTVFNVANGTDLLMEAKGCIPDAIIAMCEQLKCNR